MLNAPMTVLKSTKPARSDISLDNHPKKCERHFGLLSLRMSMVADALYSARQQDDTREAAQIETRAPPQPEAVHLVLHRELAVRAGEEEEEGHGGQVAGGPVARAGDRVGCPR